MKTKNSRLNLIKEYIKQGQVRTQEELLKYLQSQGFKVTQATVSRDIADIGLTKNGAGYYVLAQDEELRSIFKTMVVDVSKSGNIVLVKTLAAAAQTVARYIDSAEIQGIMGSVAGDDTIFLLIVDDMDSCIVLDKLRDYKS